LLRSFYFKSERRAYLKENGSQTENHMNLGRSLKREAVDMPLAGPPLNCQEDVRAARVLHGRIGLPFGIMSKIWVRFLGQNGTADFVFSFNYNGL
jgi:hypothetical protein